jgi:uncharacterized protein YndB with AHSA1/START domain
LDPVTVSTTIGRPREEVFEYLADVANHPEFTDHFLVDWHLTREDSYGRGAGARFRYKAPFQRFDGADITLAEVERPYRIVGLGRGGKYNRIKITTTYTLTEAAAGTTQVDMTTETEPPLITDRLMEALGTRGWYRRKAGRALRRLRSILEEGIERGRRATVAGR